jgi:hypothetical protein
MSISFKLLAAGLLTIPLALVEAPAQTPDTVAAAEPLCDYCGDYTDAATSAGSVQSTYRAGIGYATAPSGQAAAEPKDDGNARILTFRVQGK